ncbi:odorant receptor Or2-like [Bombus vosnesenskii]|uniref:Odorant receptor Or2-like n=1 Tax=Bombus vosnesenskii TaxID=207650 RepID=A0A6J3JT88_9HYME|nr:odorant receptor Or2-like [Bombus vosnesenskii]
MKVATSYPVEFISLASERLNYYYCLSVAQRSCLFIFKYELGNDSLFFGIIFHLCGQVEILKLDFKRLRNETEKTREHFSALTKRHVYLLNLAKMLDDTISSILAVQLFTSCTLICTSGLQFIIALSVGNIVMTIKTFIVLGTLLGQLFAYSYVGDYLNRQMEGIGDSIYSCSWYDIPKSVTKDIIYVIMRAQDPVYLKAGKFFILNMETYMSIIKTSMSYLSVLRVMISA